MAHKSSKPWPLTKGPAENKPARRLGRSDAGSYNRSDQTSIQPGGATMKVKEKSLTIGDVTFETFEEFYQYVKARQISKEEAIRRMKQRLSRWEEKYKMTSEEFYRTIAGTPAEDEVDYLIWKMDYRTYLRLTEDD
jgi:hypothetical protein